MDEGPPRGSKGDILNRENSGVYNHEKPNVDKFECVMKVLDFLYDRPGGVGETGSGDALYEFVSFFMGYACRPLGTARIDNFDHFTGRVDLCKDFLILLEGREIEPKKKQMCKDTLELYLGRAQNSLNLFQHIGERRELIDAINLMVESTEIHPQIEPTGSASEQPALTPETHPRFKPAGPPDPDAPVLGGKPVQSMATLQIIDRMISIICAREH